MPNSGARLPRSLNMWWRVRQGEVKKTYAAVIRRRFEGGWPWLLTKRICLGGGGGSASYLLFIKVVAMVRRSWCADGEPWLRKSVELESRWDWLRRTEGFVCG